MGIATEATGDRTVIYVDELAGELKRIIRKGLPVTMRSAGDRLPNLRNVAGRSKHPEDMFSRYDALTITLEQLVGELDDEHYGDAARILFATTPGTRGLTLTARREKAAGVLGYDVDHFRKRIEPKILDVVAEALSRDMVRYKSRLRRAVQAYEVPRPTPNLVTKDITREEELVSRIWQHLFEVRAERIAGLCSDDSDERQRHRNAEESAARRLQVLTDQYATTFGKEYIPLGEVDYAIEGLEKLVVWSIDAYVARPGTREEADALGPP